jgi:hypothetical protein
MARAILGGRFSWRPISKLRTLMFGESPMWAWEMLLRRKSNLMWLLWVVDVFNRVINCENAHELWKTIKEQNKGSKEVSNERYGCLLEEFNSFKQLANENVKSMYSHLNGLVNEINVLVWRTSQTWTSTARSFKVSGSLIMTWSKLSSIKRSSKNWSHLISWARFGTWASNHAQVQEGAPRTILSNYKPCPLKPTREGDE